MLKLIPLLCLALLLALTPAARAQRVGDKAPELEFSEAEQGGGGKKYKFADYAGKIVLVIFWRTGDSTSLDALVEVHKLAKKYNKRGVVAIFASPDGLERVKSMLESKKVEGEFVSGGLIPQVFNITSYPQLVMIDTRQRIAWRGDPFDDLEERLQDQIKKTPPPGADPAMSKARKSEARKFMEQKEWGRAYSLMLEVVDVSREDEVGGPDRDLIKKIEEGAGKWIDEVKGLIDKKEYDKAAKLLADIIVRFGGHKLQGERKIVEEAESERARIEAEKEGRGIVKKALENSRGQLALDQAAELERIEQYFEAFQAYRDISEKYPETAASEAADKAMERITSTPEIQGMIDQARAMEQANRWLEIGDLYAKLELADDARDYYEKVIAKYPETKPAEKAAERLEKLPPRGSTAPQTAPAEESGESEASEKSAPAEKDKPKTTKGT